MAGKRFKAPPIPDGHFAMGAKGRAVNVGRDAYEAARLETARQRRVWNHFLGLNVARYDAEGKFVFYAEMAAMLTRLRRDDAWIGAGGCDAQQQTLRALDRALRHSFPTAKNRKGFPDFRKHGDHDDRLTVPAQCLRWLAAPEGNITHVGFPRLPMYRVKGLRVPKGARIASGTLRVRNGDVLVSLNLVADPNVRPDGRAVERPQPTVPSVGIDGGFMALATLSTGQVIPNPRLLKKAKKKLRRAQKAVCRKKRHSVNRERCRREVAKIHGGVASLRQAHHHRASREVVDRHALVSMETLGLAGMAKGLYGGSVGDAGLGEFMRQVAYKAEWAGRPVRRLGMFDRSTGCCPDCGLVGGRLHPRVRSWTCAGCGTTHGRDLAAARWIDAVGTGRIVPTRAGEVGLRKPEPEAAHAPRPKRGTAANRKPGVRSPGRRRGPPANVPIKRVDGRPASTG